MTPAFMLVLAASANLLTLEGALKTAETKQPQLIQARAQTAAAEERVGEAYSPMLPQATGTFSDSINAGNQVTPTGVSPAVYYDRLNLGLTVSQYIWDFGATPELWHNKQGLAAAQNQTEQSTRLQVQLTVRNAYFNAVQMKALIGVAKDTLRDQNLHLVQSNAYVKAGTYPQINVATTETSVAQAELGLIQAQNNYDTAKVTLNQAMGVMDMGEYEVADEWLKEVKGEDGDVPGLVNEAEGARPDLASLDTQMKAQRSLIASYQGLYWPSIGASFTGNLGAVASFDQTTNGAATKVNGILLAGTTPASAYTAGAAGANAALGVSLSWAFFQGYLTNHQVKEQEANLLALEAQHEQLRQQVDANVISAELSVKAGKAGVIAAEKAVVNARLQLQLASESYKQGVGSVVQLTDSQSAMTTAAGQQVQAYYTLAAARVTLINALGRPE